MLDPQREAFQHGEHEANINSTSNVNLTIGQRIYIHKRVEKAQSKNTLRIGHSKYHVHVEIQLNIGQIGYISQETDRMKTYWLGLD